MFLKLLYNMKTKFQTKFNVFNKKIKDFRAFLLPKFQITHAI